MASPYSSVVGLGVVGRGGRVICTIAIAPGFDPDSAKDAKEFAYCAELGANARLIAASPTMAEYIQRKADEGDEEAARIMETIHARS
jgi:hypothetical protein